MNPHWPAFRLGRYVNAKTAGLWDSLWRGLGHGASTLSINGIAFVGSGFEETDSHVLFYDLYGRFPRYTMTQEWTTLAGATPRGGFWHRDNATAMTLRVFTYLTDVHDLAYGPHQYVLRSHLDRVKHYAGEEPCGEIITVFGPAGTTFLEVPHGLHRATPVLEGSRSIREVQYSYAWQPGMERI